MSLDLKLNHRPPNWNENGRLRPPAGSVVYSEISRRYFRFEPPPLDFFRIHRRYEEHLGQGELPSKLRFEELCAGLRKDLPAELFHGVALPFFLPAIPPGADYGALLEKIYIPGVEKSFRAEFNQFNFVNHCAGVLEGAIRVVPGTRHDRLVEALKVGPIVGWYFPESLSEYSIPSQRAAIGLLPEGLSLSGPLESASALLGSPGLLVGKETYPPLLCLSAASGPNEDFFYYFESYGWNLTFNQRSMRGAVSEYWAGGLTAFISCFP